MDKFQLFLLWAPIVLFSMVAHEYAHGYAALQQGDATAYQLGRLTWNPVKHIDPVFTVLVPVMTWYTMGMIFGGAKPVPVVPSNYRNYKRGDIIVSLAGIATNLALSVICTLLLILFGVIGRGVPSAAGPLLLLQKMMAGGIFVNLLLAVFNLLPIPPLDGSHVMKYLLPPSLALRYQQVGRFGLVIVLVLLLTGFGIRVLQFWMTPVFFLMRFALELAHPVLLESPFRIPPLT